MVKRVLLICLVFLAWPCFGFAATYWVHPDGAAAWTSDGCQSESDPESGRYCSLATANTNATGGDTINLMSGDYTTTIQPSNSGSANNPITFKSYVQYEAVWSAGVTYPILFIGKGYVIIDGIKVDGAAWYYFIGYGSNYNEVKNCYFTGATSYQSSYITGYSTSYMDIVPSTYNWIHNNTFYRTGNISDVCDDQGDTIRIGGTTSDVVAYNLIENNSVHGCGHTCLSVYGDYTIVRNNIIHNDDWMTNVNCQGVWGNRCALTEQNSAGGPTYNLFEKNRFGYAGTPVDDNGAMGFQDVGRYNIHRYNAYFANGAAGFDFKGQATDGLPQYLHIYNNTMYKNGGNALLPTNVWAGINCNYNISTYPVWYNVIKNNLAYDNYTADIDSSLETGTYNEVTPNWCTTTTGESCHDTHYGDPLFVDPDITDPTDLSGDLPNLNLQVGSGAINNGSHLTTVSDADSSSGTTLVVEDGAFFVPVQAWENAATWSFASRGATVVGDQIKVGQTVETANTTRITNVSGNTLTIDPAISRQDGDYVWLYSVSDGTIVLYGSAPDYGAYEYGSGTPTLTIPQGVHIGGGIRIE